MTADPFRLYGTREREQPSRPLKARRLTAELVNGNLRTIRYDGVEVLRAVSYIVRDRDWGTYSPQIDDLAVEEQDGSFAVTYRASVRGAGDTTLAIDVRIEGTENELSFRADAVSTTGFETNRCGFCILHPIVGVAGGPVEVEHVDGTVEQTVFPDLIEPWQPFKEMRSITHPVMTGVLAECRMVGDTFEMEDQRNWSDASYKTYVRPLALPWPYRLEPGQRIVQSVVLKLMDARADGSAHFRQTESSKTVIEPGWKTGRLPAIGLVIRPEDARSTIEAATLLAGIAPQELIFHFDPLAGHGQAELREFAGIAGLHAGRSTLEIALPCRLSPLEECRLIAGWLRSVSYRPDAILISPAVDRQSTPPGSQWPDCPPMQDIYAAAHTAFAGIRLGGGMLSYFTELNRKRVPAAALDFISHCTNPIVHAADDLSVMQTLEALPFITRSVRAIYGDRPYRIGPSTIAMRQNPYGSRTMENFSGQRIPMANVDPRHNGRFAEAFAMAYAIRVLDADLECLTLSALTGPFGLVAGAGEPTEEGGIRPLHATVSLLSRLSGATFVEAVSSTPDKVLAFVSVTEGNEVLHLVNVTAEDQGVDLSAYPGLRDLETVLLEPFETRALPLPASFGGVTASTEGN